MEQPKVNFDDTSIAFQSQSDKELRKTYLIFASMNYNWLVKLGTIFIKFALKLNLPVKNIIKKTIFNHFCGGETVEDCHSSVEVLGKFHIYSILDYSVEGADDEESYEHTTQEIIRTIQYGKTDINIPFSVFKVTGIASTPLLAKVQQKASLSEEEQSAYEKVKERVDRICREAHAAKVRVLIDGEESWIQDTIDSLANEMMARYNQNSPIVYNTYQMYRWEMLDHLKAAHLKAVAGSYYLGAKLVRGAYMEKERDRAVRMGYPDPIQASKEATDEDYNRALLYCLNNKQRIALVSGSHNEYSNYYLILLMEKHGVTNNDPNFYFAQLYGMSDNISFNLAANGYNVVKYVPYGPVEKVMPYLFRRAEENTSVAGQSSREFTLIKREMKRRKMARKAK